MTGGARYRNRFNRHFVSVFGKRPVEAITANELNLHFESAWDTPSKGTIDQVLGAYAEMLKWARKRGMSVTSGTVRDAREGLGKSKHKEAHHRACHWQDVPDLYAALPDTPAGYAVRILFLTGMRAASARFATVEQFDANYWKIPAPNMKRGIENWIPITPLLKTVVQQAKIQSGQRTGLLFPSSAKEGVVTYADLSRAIEATGYSSTPHGGRTAFRRWAVAHKVPFDVAESILHHKIGSKAQEAYLREDSQDPNDLRDMADSRRDTLLEWQAHLTSASRIMRKVS